MGTIRATEYIADIGATAHLIGANVLGAGLAARPANNQLTPFGTVAVPGTSAPAAAALGNVANVPPVLERSHKCCMAAINAHGAAVVRFVRSAAGNRGVWAGGTQVLLTANEQMSPDVGPRALKIRSMITEFVAENNATLAGIGGGGFFRRAGSQVGCGDSYVGYVSPESW